MSQLINQSIDLPHPAPLTPTHTAVHPSSLSSSSSSSPTSRPLPSSSSSRCRRRQHRYHYRHRRVVVVIIVTVVIAIIVFYGRVVLPIFIFIYLLICLSGQQRSVTLKSSANMFVLTLRNWGVQPYVTRKRHSPKQACLLLLYSIVYTDRHSEHLFHVMRDRISKDRTNFYIDKIRFPTFQDTYDMTCFVYQKNTNTILCLISIVAPYYV